MAIKRTGLVYVRTKIGDQRIYDNYVLRKVAKPISTWYANLTAPFRTLPDFLIIGASKSGTSSLYEYLASHPNIRRVATKEPRFFDKYYPRGVSWYKSFFPFKFEMNLLKIKNKGKIMTGEATPRYLDHPYAPQRIKKLLPSAKLLVLLRNPIDRAYSQYIMIKSKRKEHLPFDEALELEESRTRKEYERMIEDPNYYSPEYYHHAYLRRGLYTEKLKRWLDVFPRNQILIMNAEKFFSDPESVYHKVLEFLDLPIYNLVSYKAVSKREYPKNDLEQLRPRLAEYFEPYNRELYKLVGEDYGWN